MSMRLAGIKLHRPHTLAEAFELLATLDESRLLAGGTDLLVEIKEGLVHPKNLISLDAVEELRGIEKQGDRLRIGSLTTPRELASHPLVKLHLPALADAARSMASPQIRSMATVGGNIASAVPSADLPPSLMAAEAAVQLVCSDSPREIALSDFFKGPRETVCGAGEVLTSVFVPIPSPNTGTAYEKFVPREANALAVASAAVRLTLKDQKIAKGIITLGAVAPTPLLACEASALLSGKRPSEELFSQAATKAAEESRPISDVRASLWFRTEVLHVLVHKALSRALYRAQNKSEKGL
ncbi:MAG: xanthine dehydrogenase family protein subunit M [Candidatus Aminicenantes bacterium]|nr:xanthine dehydrogenase family protein subunit M [Candidatus Aminicenantes bacterium]